MAGDGVPGHNPCGFWTKNPSLPQISDVLSRGVTGLLCWKTWWF